MSRTIRKDLDGSTVHDGKAYKAWNIRTDPWDFPQPYNRSEARKLLRDEILQYIRDGEETTTTNIIDHFYQHDSWLILDLLDELVAEGLIE